MASLIFIDRQSEVAFAEEIRREQHGEVGYDKGDGRIHLLSEIVFGSLLIWPTPETHMRVVQLGWNRNDRDDDGRPIEFSWMEWFIPVDEYGIAVTPKYPERFGVAYFGTLTEEHDRQACWARGMNGGLINHGWWQGKSDWSSHT
jgi:hypothetical protein